METYVDQMLSSSEWTVDNDAGRAAVATTETFLSPVSVAEVFGAEACDVYNNQPDTELVLCKDLLDSDLKVSTASQPSRKKSNPKKRAVTSAAYDNHTHAVMRKLENGLAEPDTDAVIHKLVNGCAEPDFASTLAQIKAEPECGLLEVNKCFENSVSSLAANDLLKNAEVLEQAPAGLDEDLLHLQVQFQNSNPQKVKKDGRRSLAQPLMCGYCWKEFPKSSRLIQHLRTHTGERPYACTQCGATFTRGSNLNSHMRSHMGVKNHQCKLCDKRFCRSSNLSRHMLSHSDVKSFRCQFCQHKFKQVADLHRHLRRHTGVKPYQCDVCQRCFAESGTLTKHMRTHTNETL